MDVRLGVSESRGVGFKMTGASQLIRRESEDNPLGILKWKDLILEL